jgi:hypothetical protein
MGGVLQPVINTYGMGEVEGHVRFPLNKVDNSATLRLIIEVMRKVPEGVQQKHMRKFNGLEHLRVGGWQT